MATETAEEGKRHDSEPKISLPAAELRKALEDERRKNLDLEKTNAALTKKLSKMKSLGAEAVREARSCGDFRTRTTRKWASRSQS